MLRVVSNNRIPVPLDKGDEGSWNQSSRLAPVLLVLKLDALRALRKQCHEDFAVLGQFCAKIITLRL